MVKINTMSYFYKYNFCSPAPLYATVKEELKTYFDTGAADDLMFPTYLNKCLNKLGKSSYSILETPLVIEDFQARLPDNFDNVREAWMCAEIGSRSVTSSGAIYHQASSVSTIQISPLILAGTQCSNDSCCNQDCNGECMPEVIQQAVYKSRGVETVNYRQLYLLQPGNISVKSNCSLGYSGNLSEFGQVALSNTTNPHSSRMDSFDIRDNKFVTNFRSGVVHLIYYGTEYDKLDNQMVPDNFRIKEYIEAFLKFKTFENLSNQPMDETFNQVQSKLQYYKSVADEAYIMAELEIKKQDAWTKQRRIKKTLKRLNMYRLPGRRRY